MDPVNFPAFSPPFIAESSSFSAISTFIGTTATDMAKPSKTMTQIPSKFLATPQSSSRNGVHTTARPTQNFEGLTTFTVNRATQPAAVTGHGAPKTSTLELSLPELPNWILHLLAGTLSFLLVVAVLLFVAQFPPRLGWLTKIKRWKRPGYEKICQDEPDFGFDPFYGMSSAVASAWENHESDERAKSDGPRRRRPKNLSIDTGLASRGLGIAVPGDEDVRRTPRKRQSFDEEALRMRPKSPARVLWESFTAPLPSVQIFTGGQKQTEPIEDYVETGLYSAPSVQVSTPDVFDIKSRYYKHGDVEPPGSALLKKINGGIYHVADKLSRTFYDQVTEPEEGLLLPVHNGDREKLLTPGVFVE